MNISDISANQLRRAASIQEQIEKLKEELNRILGTATAAAAVVAPKKRKMSAAARALISAAQKKRWAAKRATISKAAKGWSK